jgi:hypothetical protein
MPSSPNSPRNSQTPQEGERRALPYGGSVTYLNGKWYTDDQVNYFNAQNQQQQDEIGDLVFQIESVCNQACKELEVEFNNLKNIKHEK